ncbi:hypothetical protein F4809DRAFT_651776 [Biscogniauxia mediterranea]|nr:hypothetical protein F4809DRAFT_651776 [Biscogniauxia mediterranea]
MSSNPGPSIPHRAVSSIRAGGQSSGQGLSATPHTPSRPLSSSFGSPSSLRADDDVVVIELGSRKLRIGFAGDAGPKKIASFTPEQQARAGDFRAWEAGYQNDWRRRAAGKPWGFDHELWQLDARGQDLGLIADKLERELRDAFTKYLLIDTRPRKFTLVLPPTIPLPLLSSALDIAFYRFQTPTVSLLSSPVMATMAAGARAGLVVDLGWHETTVTAVYEYREVRTWRTVRAGKMLVEETFEFLSQAIQGPPTTTSAADTVDRLGANAVSFEECEEVATRMLWCRRAGKQQPTEEPKPPEGLPTVHEGDEEGESPEPVPPSEDNSPMAITLNSCQPPRTLEIPFSQLAEPCESTFFESRLSPSCFDDHELPVHLLVYRALLQLPLDVRAVCMSRIIFTGGCSNIIGIRGRIFDEVSLLAQKWGWDPVRGKGVAQHKANPKLQRRGSRQASEGPVPVPVPSPATPTEGEGTGLLASPALITPVSDPVEALIKKERKYKAPVQGTLRAIDSLGPWCGASMATQLKVPALATIDRELWVQHGVNGACRPSEVDVKTTQRQSMGPSGLIRSQASQSNSFTLGVWGAL